MDKLTSIACSTTRIMNRVNTVLALICGGIVFLYMFIVSANITGRYVFNSPVNGTLEIGQMVLAIVIFFSLGYAQMGDSHIRVTVILNSLPAKWQKRVEASIFIIGCLMMILMAYKALPYALESFAIRETHMSVDVPIWPTKFIFFIGWCLMAFQFFLEFINKLILEDKSVTTPVGEKPND